MENAQQLLLSLHESGVQLYLNEQSQLAFRASRKLQDHEKAQIRSHKAALSRLLTNAETSLAGAAEALSCNQQSLCFLCQDERLNSGYLITFALAFEKKPDPVRLQRALRMLQAAQPALRTGFLLHEGEFRLRRDPQVELPWQEHRLTGNNSFEHWLAAFADHHMPLEQGTLWRLCFVEQESRAWLAVQAHHLIWDGWSSGLFRRLLLEAWQRAEAVDATPLVPQQGMDLFAAEQQRRATDGYWREGLDYWQQLLRRAPAQTGWCLRQAGKPAGRTAHRTIAVPMQTTEVSGRFLRLLAAWLLAQAYQFEEDSLVTGVPVANRHYAPALEQALGYFNNVIPVVADNLLSTTPARLYKQLKQQWRQSMAYQDVPFDQIVVASRRGRTDGINPVFQNSFAYQGFDWKRSDRGALAHSLITVPPVVAKFPLILQLAELDNGLSATIEYDSAIFTNEEIDNLLQGWLTFVAQFNDADKKGGEMTVSPETSASPAWTRGESLTLPADLPEQLPDALLRTARRYPEKGLRFIEADGDEHWLSYAELHRRACRLAAGLQQGEVWSLAGRPVIVLSDALQPYVENFWAVMLAGGVPVTVAAADSYDDPSSGERLLSVWRHLEQPVVICDEVCAEKLPPLQQQHPRMEVVVPAALTPTADYLPWRHEPDGLAILQLSSGSTGAPKCIQQSHRAIISYSALSAHSRGYRPEHISLNWLSFDHVGGLLYTHLRDVCLGREQIHLATHWVLEDPLRWPLTMARFGVTHSWSPNFGYKLIAAAAHQQPECRADLSAVEELMNGGEMVVADTLRDFNQAFESWQLSPRAIAPAFGMAECCTVIVGRPAGDPEHSVLSSDRITLGAEQSQLGMSQFVALGGVMAETEIRIVDDENRLLQEYQVGRLQIRGRTVTSGYYGAEAATGKALLDDGWFDSGDLGLLADGELYLTGRGQEMIVLNGINYFCHELEACAEQVAGVKPTWVAAVGYQHGEQEAAALCYVTEQGVDSDAVNRQIRLQLASRLQFHPDQICSLAEADFPKTVSGKIQRRQLASVMLHRHIQTAVAEIGVSRLSWRSIPHRPDAPAEYRSLAVTPEQLDDLAALTAELLRQHQEQPATPIVLYTDPAVSGQLYAWARTLMQEHPGLQLLVMAAKHQRLWPEQLSPGLYREVRHQLEQRYEQSAPSPARSTGVDATQGYSIVTGASGAIAGKLIERLCQRGEKLVLISRSGSAEDWFSSLEHRWPGQCLLLTAEITDLETLERGWWQLPETLRIHPPARVYHLAGTLISGTLAALDNEQLNRDRRLRCLGADNLRRLLSRYEQPAATAWICFSSVNGWRGGDGMGAYNLGNGALCDWAAQQRRNGIPVWWLGWSSWQDTGMSVGVVDAERLSLAGLQVMPPEVALTLLERLLQQPPADYLVGVQPQQALTSQTMTQPLTADQQRMADIWSSLLKHPVTNAQAGFFEQGGNSILLLQLLEKLKQAWQQPGLALTDLFKAPTLAEMTRMVTSPKEADNEVIRAIPRNLLNSRRKKLKQKTGQLSRS